MQANIYTQECTLAHTQQIDLKICVHAHSYTRHEIMHMLAHIQAQCIHRETCTYKYTKSWILLYIHIHTHACMHTPTK